MVLVKYAVFGYMAMCNKYGMRSQNNHFLSRLDTTSVELNKKIAKYWLKQMSE